jgi:putative transcriptional regulator
VALSNKIRKLRFKNGEMTQKHLAERVGVSRQTMNAIENGRHAPTVELAIRIADVFGITVDQLFDLDYDGRPVRR